MPHAIRRRSKIQSLERKLNQLKPKTCYQYTKDSSTIKLNVIINQNMVTGNLLYDYHQKDRSTGKITGELKADILFADYIFISEDVESVRDTDT